MKGGDTLKRFTEGLLFGAGFAISFTVVWYVAAYVVYPVTVGPKIEKEANKQLSEFNSKIVPPEVRREMERPFHEMGPEESIEAASATALAKYEPGPDGRMKAVITEFLKKELDAKVPYDIGDEYPRGSYYPKENVSRGDALLLFFKRSPFPGTSSMAIYHDRIAGLSDMPMELFRKKVKESGDGKAR